MAERENLTNASALALSRLNYLAEQQRAHAIHAAKAYRHHDIRALYLREEPALFSAIRAGDRREARAILNRILLVIHQHAGERLDLMKSIFMELIVSMCRTAVEAGGAPEELLGANYTSLAELSQLRNEADVAHWLARTLDQLLDAIHRHRQRDPGAVLASAMAYIEKHIAEPISRDDVARAVYLSPSHFSFLIRKESGVTFTDLLNRVRTDRAAELLGQRRLCVREVAQRTGFEDASYFTKVFKRYRNLTPLQYRRHISLPIVPGPSTVDGDDALAPGQAPARQRASKAAQIMAQ
jgi:YesN/AraC family two-component response regulator